METPRGNDRSDTGQGDDKAAKDHEAVLGYLGSHAWEARLQAAREMREKVLAERDARPERDDATATADRGDAALQVPSGGSGRAEGLPGEGGADMRAPDARSAAAATGAGRPRPRPLAAPTAPRRVRQGRRRGAWLPLAGAVSVVVPVVLTLVLSQGTPSWLDATLARQAPAPGGAQPDPAAAGASGPPIAEALQGFSLMVVTADAEHPALSELRKQGLIPGEVRTTPFALQETTVAYYHPGDAEAARLLSSRFSGLTLDLTGLKPSPPLRTLDVLLGAD